MSYLDTPRIHFSGGFSADPSTVNNTTSNFNPATPAAALVREWDPNGRHIIAFDSCSVRTAVANSGPTSDGLVGSDVTLLGRLVDVDVEAQTFSQIFGGTVTVTLPLSATGRGSFTGTLKRTTLRDLWLTRATGGPSGFPRFGGVYSSTLENVTFDTASTSFLFEQLRSLATSFFNTLAIKFVLYAYDPAPGPNFTKGRVVGTIGPWPPGTSIRRKLFEQGASAWGAAPFQVDTSRHKLVIDLGNAVPEVSPGGARGSFGSLTPKIMATPPISLPALDYSLAHYLTTAGVEEVSITTAQATALASHPLALEKSSPIGIVLQERPGGSFVDPSEIVLRLFAPQSDSINFLATQFGRAKAGATISMALKSPAPASPSAGALTFPASVTTNSRGLATATFAGSNPGSPRGTFLDGQLYQVDFFDGPAVPSNVRGTIIIRVFDDFPSVSSPTWTNVQPIFEQYSRLYPSMKSVFDLASAGTLRPLLPLIKAALLRNFDAQNYMPVTRDLSPKKRDMIVKWIDAGAAGIP
jgi:hypothetical protein